ncbi:lipoprotein signal peptidase [Hahella chejuensis KCTC 2396]|uniref:Lipoprotein signal peptidase n=1 Tax=Hahella chejuensis (strain KCTC 2396) TaxID=349521 RepID=Q2S9U0_HAHCH|nr:signal peptidase II [Hahella chejuensis]ABC32584.1 lipoprotein signal peptidase [Hahella chejuensis KCTC 2396]
MDARASEVSQGGGEMQKVNPGMLRWLWLTLAVIVLDLGTKWYVSTNMVLGESVPVAPFFSFTLLHNTGAAFSFLADASGWQRWFFIILAAVVSVVLVLWLVRLTREERWMACALSLVLGGALGNLYDRAVLGYVVDFLHFFYGGYNFPAFNFADTTITIGAFMIAIDVFRNPSGATEDK